MRSIRWDVGPTYLQAIRDADTGTFGDHNYDLSLATGGIALLQTETISDELWTTLETAKAVVVDGSISVPAAETRAEIEELIGCG